MSEELKHSVMSQAQSVADAAASNPKIAMVVATGTTGIGIDLAIIQSLQPIVAMIAALLGITLTIILIIRNTLGTLRERAEYKRKLREIEESKRSL